jgi:hypothetical protein
MLGGPPTRSPQRSSIASVFVFGQSFDRLAVGETAGDDVLCEDFLDRLLARTGTQCGQVARRTPFSGKWPAHRSPRSRGRCVETCCDNTRPPLLTFERGRSGAATSDRGRAPRRRVLSVVRLERRERISARTADMRRILRRRRHGLVERTHEAGDDQRCCYPYRPCHAALAPCICLPNDGEDFRKERCLGQLLRSTVG